AFTSRRSVIDTVIMEKLTTYLDKLTNAASIEALWQMHVERMAAYGFDRILYGHTRFRSGSHLGDPQDWVVLTNPTAEYMRSFVGEGLYYHAPMLRWSLENDGACSWRAIEEMARSKGLTQPELRVVEFNRRMGVTAGFTISFRSL